MSPGLRSRPSLSGGALSGALPGSNMPEGVAGTTVPAFVERGRSRRIRRRRLPSGVAGTTVPAFVERAQPMTRCKTRRRSGCVSPGLRSRPSLSVTNVGQRRPRSSMRVSPGLRSRPSLSVLSLYPTPVPTMLRVAGTTVPAFVERLPAAGDGLPARRRVSPGLRSRPSLSDPLSAGVPAARRVSPGLRSRPSLSDGSGTGAFERGVRPGVAGTTVPAFVERRNDHAVPGSGHARRVAGTTVPAFVERGQIDGLVGSAAAAGVAGTTVPAFVERRLRGRRTRRART